MRDAQRDGGFQSEPNLTFPVDHALNCSVQLTVKLAVKGTAQTVGTHCETRYRSKTVQRTMKSTRSDCEFRCETYYEAR